MSHDLEEEPEAERPKIPPKCIWNGPVSMEGKPTNGRVVRASDGKVYMEVQVGEDAMGVPVWKFISHPFTAFVALAVETIERYRGMVIGGGEESKYGKVFLQKKEIPEGEPVFLLRAQDVLAPETVRAYAKLRRERGDHDGADSCEAVAAKMEAWPVKKLPD